MEERSNMKINKKEDKVGLKVIRIVQDDNYINNNIYINLSNNSNKEEEATVGLKVIRSSHKRDLRPRRIPGSSPGRGASSLFFKKLNFVFNY